MKLYGEAVHAEIMKQFFLLQFKMKVSHSNWLRKKFLVQNLKESMQVMAEENFRVKRRQL